MAKVVAITGVCGGIGLALAEEFKSRGFEIVGIDVAHESPPGITFYQCDLTHDEACEKTFSKIKKNHPSLSLWINNAGLARLGDFLSVSQDTFDLVMAINFRAQVTASRFWLRHFEERGDGHIVNVSSAAGMVPAGDMTSYVASKHAVVGFTRGLQLELDSRESKVKLTLVTPGFVETKLMQIGAASGFPEKLKALVSTPEKCAKEIADGVLAGEREITPTLSGKVMTGIYQLPFGDRIAALAYKASRKK